MAQALASQHPLLLASAAACAVLSLGHTTKGLDQFKHPSLAQLPKVLRGAVKTGWYEGSAFFAVVAILNYKWSQTALLDIYDKTMAGLFTSMLVAAGASYFRSGDKPTALTLTLVAVLQGLGAKRASS